MFSVDKIKQLPTQFEPTKEELEFFEAELKEFIDLGYAERFYNSYGCVQVEFCKCDDELYLDVFGRD